MFSGLLEKQVLQFPCVQKPDSQTNDLARLRLIKCLKSKPYRKVLNRLLTD